jgi:hypothetical protein
LNPATNPKANPSSHAAPVQMKFATLIAREIGTPCGALTMTSRADVNGLAPAAWYAQSARMPPWLSPGPRIVDARCGTWGHVIAIV